MVWQLSLLLMLHSLLQAASRPTTDVNMPSVESGAAKVKSEAALDRHETMSAFSREADKVSNSAPEIKTEKTATLSSKVKGGSSKTIKVKSDKVAPGSTHSSKSMAKVKGEKRSDRPNGSEAPAVSRHFGMCSLDRGEMLQEFRSRLSTTFCTCPYFE